MVNEVPLNKYAWKMGTNHLFVKNGYGLHMYYNTIPNNRTYEREFCYSVSSHCYACARQSNPVVRKYANSQIGNWQI